MPQNNFLSNVIRTIRQLGIEPVALNGLYRLGLKSGYFRLAQPGKNTGQGELAALFIFPQVNEMMDVLGEAGKKHILAEAEEINKGNIRLFGHYPYQLDFPMMDELRHWVDYENGKVSLSRLNLPFDDIKFLWEPARFGWAFTLGRAFFLSEDERFAESFWEYTEKFLGANPAYFGPHWMSAQEVAIRLMVFVWAGQVFANAACSTAQRKNRLARAVAEHAARIPSTLIYARSQNNNHLLTEASGLYTAGLALPWHPNAKKWRAQGWKWLKWCFEHQVSRDGSYVQHSSNYHRLMLQVALWCYAISKGDCAHALEKETFYRAMNFDPRQPVSASNHPHREYRDRKEVRYYDHATLAARWMFEMMDAGTGRAVNLGANDGAYIFPLSVCPFEDFRPVGQAAMLAFCGERPFEPGMWDELALWFCQPAKEEPPLARYVTGARARIDLKSDHSWAYLRAVRFQSRPSHADQLHLDLWWRGINVACDAGTYLYNAAPPWDNSLTVARVHNTVVVDGRDQMTRASKFLYLDWAQKVGGSFRYITQSRSQSAGHTGYLELGVSHSRAVTAYSGDRWLVEDMLVSSGEHEFSLHWLVPDWKWQVDTRMDRLELRLASPHGPVTLFVRPQVEVGTQYDVSLARAGEVVFGRATHDPLRGWFSPTYACKQAALSLVVKVSARGNLKFVTEFYFPG